ncbi:MAG: YjfB family protein [Syntrophomonadales bacterium]
MNLSQGQLQQAVGTAVLKMAMDTGHLNPHKLLKLPASTLDNKYT